MRKEIEILKSIEQRVKVVEQALGMGDEGVKNIHFLLSLVRSTYGQGEFLNSENSVLKEFLTEKGLMQEMEAWLDKKQAAEQAPPVLATPLAAPLGDLVKVK